MRNIIILSMGLLVGSLTLVACSSGGAETQAPLPPPQVAIRTVVSTEAAATTTVSPITATTTITKALVYLTPTAVWVAPPPTTPGSGSDLRCPGAPPSELRIGMQVKVVNQVLVRSKPEAADNNTIGRLSNGVNAVITDGPICGPFDGGAYIYWKIHTDQNVMGLEEATPGTNSGWVAEALPGKIFLQALNP